ncbi:hypothetical protein TEA_016698 [Camellia sinensis var. sinensis]|uniref:peroxidase n=1 Tax=Camellia sinensis var. sinensis TaxID=542762 RepID=A0A4S4DR85_CAMSN|nr:hypothetical protein TEA_016698 [Camellia sinensis var. sinensis]
MMMMATCIDPSSLLCSSTAAAASTSRRNFKFPAKSRPTLPNEALYYHLLIDCASFGRREVLSLVTIPFFLHLHESPEGFRANAADDYFLVKEEVRKVLSKGKAAGVLRLVFHDAGTFETDGNAGGMNGSIVYELDRPENTVSWADMIAVAGAEAVSVCGGPRIPVQLGRLDSMVPDPEGKLPQESLDATGLKQCFQRKGFTGQLTWSNNHKFTALHLYIGLLTCSSVASIQGEHLLDVLKSMLQNFMLDHVCLLLDSGGLLHSGKVPISMENLAGGFQDIMMGRWDGTQELVALSGAHTLGSKGFGNPTVFDNSYFKILLGKPWLSSGGMSSMIGLPSDRALVEDDECLRWISKYADNQNLFFEDFKNVYTKLVNTGARWKTSL